MREEGARSLSSQPLPESDGEKKNKAFLTLSPQVGEPGLVDRRTYALIVIGHHLDLFLHVIIGLGCDYVGPLT